MTFQIISESAWPFFKLLLNSLLSAFTCQIKIWYFTLFDVLTLDALQQLMPWAGMVVCTMEGLFWLTVCYITVIMGTKICCNCIVIFIMSYYFSCVYVCGSLFHVFSLMFLCCPCNWPHGCYVSTFTINLIKLECWVSTHAYLTLFRFFCCLARNCAVLTIYSVKRYLFYFNKFIRYSLFIACVFICSLLLDVLFVFPVLSTIRLMPECQHIDNRKTLLVLHYYYLQLFCTLLHCLINTLWNKHIFCLVWRSARNFECKCMWCFFQL